MVTRTARSAPRTATHTHRAKAATMGASRGKILSSADIAIERIEENPHNPRPYYHFDSDDPGINLIADSISITGQQNPVKVYEIPDRPGYYRLVQGHRRLHSARKRNLTHLSAIIVAAPASLAEELDDLGSDDTLKEKWGMFSQMYYARELARAHGFAHINCPEISSRVGLRANQLIVAEKMFNLCDAVVAHVKLWEQQEYESRQVDRPVARDYLVESGIKVSGFTPEKAALCWDLFSALRTHAAPALTDWTDEALQIKLAQLCSRGKSNDLHSWLRGIESLAVTPGALAQIMDVLSDTSHQRSVTALVRSTNNAGVNKLAKLAAQLDRMRAGVLVLNRNPEQFGSDLALLKECNSALLAFLGCIDRLQGSVQDRVKVLERTTRQGN